MNKTRLIWNIFAWLDHFAGSVKCEAVSSSSDESWLLFETENSSFSLNLSSKEDLLAANCVLTWWANMGVDNNKNKRGQNIFDFDLTKQENRDKFTA